MKIAGMFLLWVALSGCSAKPDAIETETVGRDGPASALYVVDHGWHVGLVISAKLLESELPQLKDRFGNARFYELGWGDEGYYQASEKTATVALKAIFWSQGAVMHVAALPVLPTQYFPGSEVIATCLEGGEVASLLDYLSASFARDTAGSLIPLQAGLYGDSQFYGGVGRYHLLNTSNKWTAKALKSAGMDIAPAFKLTAGSVMGWMRNNRSSDVHGGGKSCSLPGLFSMRGQRYD